MPKVERRRKTKRGEKAVYKKKKKPVHVNISHYESGGLIKFLFFFFILCAKCFPFDLRVVQRRVVKVSRASRHKKKTFRGFPLI